MTDIAALLGRVRAATGPDRELDGAIEVQARRFEAYQVGLDDKRRAHWKHNRGTVYDGNTGYDAPRYTASVDTALALVERALPGWFVAKIDAWHNANEEVVGHGVTLQKLGPVPDTGYVTAKDGWIGASRPLAICGALLTALSHEEPTP